MTVPSTSRRAGPFFGNGVTTSFPFTFKTFAAADVQVIRTSSIGIETTLVLGSDYSIALNPDQDTSPGGTITYPVSGSPLASGERLTALGALSYEQTTDLLGGGAFSAKVVEDTFDRTVIQIQQLLELIDRCVTVPVSSGASTALPTPQALQVLAWDASGTALTNVSASSFLTIVGSSGFGIQTFSGTGAQTAFTLSQNPGAIANLEVFISGVRQVPTTDYTISGTTLTFTSAPPAGTDNILARWGQTLGIGVPSDTSVSTAKLADLSVTTTKLADDAVTFAKTQNIATARLLGRTTAGTGNIEELTTGAGLALSAGALAVTSATDTTQGIVELATNAEVQTGTDTTRAVTPAALRASALVRDTAKASTSGTTVDFTGIPSWAKRITVMLDQVSTNGTSPIIIQLGSGSIQTSGYTAHTSAINTGTGQTSATSGHIINQSVAATTTQSGAVVFTMLSNFIYVATGLVLYDVAAGAMGMSASRSSYAGAVDRVRITTVGGTDTFDAGTINIMYE